MLDVPNDVIEQDANKENDQTPSNKTGGSTTDIAMKNVEETIDILSSDDEIVHKKKKTVFQDSSEEERDLVIDDEQSKPATLAESDPEQFLKNNLDSSGSEADVLKPRRTPKQFDSDSDSGANHESNADGEMKEEVKRKKKMKKKKTKRRSTSGDSSNGALLSKSFQLTDDENDDLLKDLDTSINVQKPDGAVKGIEVKARSSCSDSDSSVGLPDDIYIVRKSEETDETGPTKKKVYKDFCLEDWQNEDVKEKEYNEGTGYKEGSGKKDKKKKETLDPVAQLVSERQRMMRETEISLPRHEPTPLQLSDCLARIPKLTALKPRGVEEKKTTFVPKLSSKNDDFFLPKDLGNFMNRFKKHLSLSAKVCTDTGPQNCAQTITSAKQCVPRSVLIKKQIQTQLKEQILAKKVEARKAAEMEKMIDEEFRTVEDPDDVELQKMLDNDEEEEMSDSNEEQDEEEVEEAEDVDEKTDRRAEKILLGEDVSSSSGEEEEAKEDKKERKYHSDTDSDLLASADEVHVNELAASSASEDDALQPSRYSLRRLTRYIRKKNLVRARKKEERATKESDSEDEPQSKEKVEKAKRKMELLLEKRKAIKQKRDAIKTKKAKMEEEKRRIEEIKRKAEEAAILAEEKRKSALSVTESPTKPSKPTVHKPWLSDSEDDELPQFETEGGDHVTSTADHVTSTGNHGAGGSEVPNGQRAARDWQDDSFLESRAARILAGEEVSSSESEPERNYHSDTDSDMLASADEVHVNELAASSASEDDALQPSRYSLRRLTRYCRKKRIKRERRHHQRVAIGSESEKEEKAKKKLQALLKRRDEIKKKIYAKKAQKAENSCTSIQDLFGRGSLSLTGISRGSLSLTGISRPSDSQSLPGSTSRDDAITSTIIPDSMDTLPVSEKTFDVDTAVRNVVEDSQFIQQSHADFLPPDEDAVFLDTQGMLRSGHDTSGDGGIEALGGGGGGGCLGSQPLDMLNLCSGGFDSTAPGSGESEGRVTVQDISFNLTRSPDILRSGLSQTPNPTKTPISKRRDPASQTPLSKGLSQTPLTRFGTLQGVLSQESEDEEEGDTVRKIKGKKRRALYSDLLDGEAEKSGSDHSDDEYEDDNDEYDESMLAKDSELPSDEEELAEQLKQVYHDQQALDEKEQIKRLKERFIQEEQGFFRTRKFHGDDANINIFSSNLGLDFEDEDVDTSTETYNAAMEKRAERLKKEQFVKEKRKKEALSGAVDEDSQAFLDSLQDMTDSNSRSAYTSSQQCGSFLKHTTGTLSRLSSITSSSLKTSSRSYVFQTVSPGQNKRKRSGQSASDSKRHKKFIINSTQTTDISTDSKQKKSIFNVIK